jgi:hypothetical protein
MMRVREPRKNRFPQQVDNPSFGAYPLQSLAVGADEHDSVPANNYSLSVRTLIVCRVDISILENYVSDGSLLRGL